MNTFIRPIAPLNEVSYNVVLLHKALEVLGMPVAAREVGLRMAGPDTLAKVRALQKQLNVRVDRSTLVNDETAAAIADVLTKRGLTAASRSFTVTGTVRLQDGSPKRQQRLLAFDLDLRGVAVYRQVKTLAEIEGNRGFEFLGLAASGVKGHYSLTFYDWQYGRAERKKADVVVYAVRTDKDGEHIIGSSRLVHCDDYSDKGLVRDLDVAITETDTRTEYEIVMAEMNAFLTESETNLRDIGASPDQLAFAAAELDLDPSRVNIAASAELLNPPKRKALSRELLYGIGRQDIRLDWTVLSRKPEDALRAAITKSVEERIIRTLPDKEVTSFIRALRTAATKQILDDKQAHGSNTLNAMLSNALPTEKQRVAFLTAVTDFKGSDFREFWSNHLPAQAEFKNKPELVAKLLVTQQLAHLTGNHQALIHELQVKRKIVSMHELFELEANDWLEIVRKTGVPDAVEGGNVEDRIARYAGRMQALLNSSFPTQRIARMVEKDTLPIKGSSTKLVGEGHDRSRPGLESKRSHGDFGMMG